MTGAELIDLFHLQVDDTSELSSTEELDLLNRIYQEVMTDRPWEITKKSFSGTQSTTVPYISLPSDFAYLTANYNFTERDMPGERPVVFVGAQYDPYKVVSWSDRRQYSNDSNTCYIDIANNRLYFTVQPTSAQAVEFDYHSVPTDLTLDTSPVFPTRFHQVLVFGMAVNSEIIQMSDKAKSYAPENKARYDKYLGDMCYWNANLVQQ